MARAIVIIMLASMFQLPGASAQDDADVVQEPPAALEAAPELPEPESLPEPTPTMVPPEPTPTPEPTPVPTLESTLAPTVEPTATTMPEPTATVTPVVEPTATSVAPTPSPEPTVVPTATPTLEPRSITIQSVIAGNMCSLNGVPGRDDVVAIGKGPWGIQEFAVFNCQAVKVNGKVRLNVSAPTGGWRYQIRESRMQPDLWRTESFNSDIANIKLENLGDFQIYLGPVNENVSGCGQVTITVFAPNGTTGSTTLGACTPDGGPAQCADIAGAPVTAALVGGVLPSIPFSFAPRTVTGSLTIAVDNSEKCQGWVLDVSATDLTSTPPAPGQQALSPRVVLPDGSRHALGTVQRLVSEGGTDASYAIPFTIEFDVPGGTAVGTYTTIVTLSTTAAPGS